MLPDSGLTVFLRRMDIRSWVECCRNLGNPLPDLLDSTLNLVIIHDMRVRESVMNTRDGHLIRKHDRADAGKDGAQLRKSS